jgi:hypothetical protein
MYKNIRTINFKTTIMKQLIKAVGLKIFLAVIAVLSGSCFVIAQDAGSSTVTTTHTESQAWYVQPWVWIVGGAVFILILVALVSGKRSDVTVTKTTVEKSDI